jgi:CelD/BcsL family acetyltransferase involved in cellulose biosynthesis
MKLQFIRDSQAFRSFADEWNSLLADSVSNLPFLRHEYLSTWWSTLGGGEWPQAELQVGVARDDRQKILGFAPLFRAPKPDGSSWLLLLGSIEISDYLDLIVPPSDLPSLVETLLQELASIPERWTLLDLYNLPETSPTIQAVSDAAAKRGWAVELQKLQPCPVITLNGGWEDYLSRLDKKQRHELRRKMRRAESAEEGVRWRIVQEQSEIVPATEALFELMSYDEEKRVFLTPSMKDHFRRLIDVAFRHHWLFLTLLEVGGKPAAVMLCFDFADALWVYNSGLNPGFSHLSPGWVLLGEVIRWATVNKRREVDFMRGREDYKYRLGGVDRFVMRLTIRREK